MALMKIDSNRQKNPLRLVLILLVLYGLIVVISMCRLLISSGLSYIIAEVPSLIPLSLIIVLFVFCYFKKSIWAFWVASSVFPVMTYFAYIMYSPDKRGWISLIVFNVLIFGYLCSKMEDYMTFIKQDTNSKEGSEYDLIEDEPKNITSFSFLAWAAVGMLVFEFYHLYNISQLPEGIRGVFQTELHDITMLVFAAAFLFFYYKKNILSWWIIPCSTPLVWFTHYLQHPFEWKLFLNMFVVWILVCFFFIYKKYEDYKLFMKQEN